MNLFGKSVCWAGVSQASATAVPCIAERQAKKKCRGSANRWPLLLLFVIRNILAATSHAQEDADVTSELLQLAMESRKVMRNGELILDVKYEAEHDNGFERSYHVLFDGDSVRVETNRDNGPDTSRFDQVDVVHAGQHIWHSTMESSPGVRVASSVTELAVSPESPDRIVSHPWYLGLAPCEWESLIYFQPHTCITGTGKVGDVTESRKGSCESGDDCWIITRTGSVGNTPYRLTAWLNPGLSNSIVRVEEMSKLSAGVQITAAVNEYQLVDSFRVLRSMHYTRTLSGRLIAEEHVDVTVVAINQGIDSSHFELSSLGIDPGTPFSVYSAVPETSGAYLWDGTKLIRDMSTPGTPWQQVLTGLAPMQRDGGGSEVGPLERTRWKWVLLVNSIVMAVLAGAIGYRLVRRQK